MAAFALGIVQFAAPKGRLLHRIIGWTWVVLLLVVSTTAFFIHEIKLWGRWSPIHLLAIFTLLTLPLAVGRARKHEVARHGRMMIALFLRLRRRLARECLHGRARHRADRYRRL